MTHPGATAVVSLASVALIAAMMSALTLPVNADTAPTSSPTSSSDAAISVVIPSDATPSPGSTSSGSGSSDGSGGAAGSGSSGGSGTNGGGTNADGSPIPASQPKENAPKLRVDKDRLQSGGWIVATATGYRPGEKAQIVLYPGPAVVGSFTVDAQGNFSARFRIPEGTLTGVHVIEVTGWESGYVANAEITIVRAVAASSWLTLWWVYVVLGVLVLGLLSVSFAFRREIAGWFSASVVPGNPT